MSNNTQKPGEKPDKPGPKVEVDPNTGKPVNPPNKVHIKPGSEHMPPTKEPGHEWKPTKK